MDSLVFSIPQSFYDSETRDNYYVDSKIKKIWAVELDLLNEFIRVCKKNNLEYFAAGGTLLGAIRHQGFIPWDDDIDVFIPRNDYEKLLKIAEAEFTFPYYFQTPLNTKDYWRAHAQLRNSTTTGFLDVDRRQGGNKGIFIDILVLDSVPNSFVLRRIHSIIVHSIKKIPGASVFFNRYEKMHGLKHLFYIVSKKISSIVGYDVFFNKLNKTCSAFKDNPKSTKLAHTTLSYKEFNVWNKEDFSGYIEMPFEMINIRCPIGFNAVLSTRYGKNYMDLPDQPPASFHGNITFNADLSYLDYMKND